MTPVSLRRYALTLAAASCLLLVGCTSSRSEASHNNRDLEKLMRHGHWPQAKARAQKEVRKREVWWPDSAEYLPMDHTDKIWTISAMTGTPNGDVERTVVVSIGDDDSIVAYKRYWRQQPVESWPDFH